MKIKEILRELLSSPIKLKLTHPLVQKFKSIDQPLPCSLAPEHGMKWLQQKIKVQLTPKEIRFLNQYKLLKE